MRWSCPVGRHAFFCRRCPHARFRRPGSRGSPRPRCCKPFRQRKAWARAVSRSADCIGPLVCDRIGPRGCELRGSTIGAAPESRPRRSHPLRPPHRVPAMPQPAVHPAYETWSIRKPAVRAAGGIVTSQHYLASEVGARVLAAGGNAVDAAVATGLAIGTVEPWMSGLGGGGFMIVYVAAERRAYAVEFGMRAPRGIDPAAYPLADGVDADLFGWSAVVAGSQRARPALDCGAGVRGRSRRRARTVRDALLARSDRAGRRACATRHGRRLVRDPQDCERSGVARPVSRDRPGVSPRRPRPGTELARARAGHPARRARRDLCTAS